MKKELSLVIIENILPPKSISYKIDEDGTILFQENKEDVDEFYLYFYNGELQYGIKITRFENKESMIRRIKDELEFFKSKITE